MKVEGSTRSIPCTTLSRMAMGIRESEQSCCGSRPRNCRSHPPSVLHAAECAARRARVWGAAGSRACRAGIFLLLWYEGSIDAPKRPPTTLIGERTAPSSRGCNNDSSRRDCSRGSGDRCQRSRRTPRWHRAARHRRELSGVSDRARASGIDARGPTGGQATRTRSGPTRTTPILRKTAGRIWPTKPSMRSSRRQLRALTARRRPEPQALDTGRHHDDGGPRGIAEPTGRRRRTRRRRSMAIAAGCMDDVDGA